MNLNHTQFVYSSFEKQKTSANFLRIWGLKPQLFSICFWIKLFHAHFLLCICAVSPICQEDLGVDTPVVSNLFLDEVISCTLFVLYLYCEPYMSRINVTPKCLGVKQRRNLNLPVYSLVYLFVMFYAHNPELYLG